MGFFQAITDLKLAGFDKQIEEGMKWDNSELINAAKAAKEAVASLGSGGKKVAELPPAEVAKTAMESKVTKSGKPFGVMVVEDFTGSAEVVMWGESFVPARDAGTLVPGKVIKFKAAIQIDDRTDSRRLTGYELSELKPRGSSATKGAVELTLWTARHSERDLSDIREALAANPGKVPVFLHFQNSAGRRATVELGEKHHVKRTEILEKALGRWID